MCVFAICGIPTATTTVGRLDSLKWHFSCPFANLWLEHGAERATELLNINTTNSPVGVERCAIGPGLVGGAHQHGLSPGYSSNCSGSPAQGSPYMWPLAWSAKIEIQLIPFGTNSPSSTAHGREWFRHDRNWQRKDTFGEGNTTRIHLHRGSRLAHINMIGDKMIDCFWMNMSLIGPNRPDWFLDNRGGAPIDNQYLGKEFVIYQGKPRLVRKWRKSGIDK